VLGRIGWFLTRRARLVVVIWAVLTAVLALQGLGLDKKLSVAPIYIEGTTTKQEHEISLREFGSEDALVVMLRGPRGAVDRQGQVLAGRLEALPRALVVSPWTPGAAIRDLRPSPGVAALLVTLPHRTGESSADVADSVRRQVDRTVVAPVRASLAGGPVLSDSLQSAVKQAALDGELLAIPILLVVLLFVFRSVLAAAMPVLIGGAVVASTRGVLDQLTGLVHIDSFAAGAVGMMGLALGVDYSLLVISRFREEIEKSGDVGEAMRTTLIAIGRSVIPAATGLVLAMLIAAQVVPGAIANSVSLAIIVATVLSALSAVFVVPAFLMLFGQHLERWSLPRRRRTGAPSRRARWIAARPAIALPFVFALVLLAGWAFTLDTGIASVALLPSGDSGRKQSEEIQQTLGPGWTAPMEIVMDGGAQPVTTPHRMRALASFQRRVEKDPGVQTMAGFTAFERGTSQLEGFEDGLVAQEHGLVHLGGGLSRVQSGAVLNTKGLVSADEGASQLASAVDATHTGAGTLADGLLQASTGTDHLSRGLGHASDGSDRLASGTSKASTGLGRLADALKRAERRSGEGSNSARLIKNAMKAGNDGLAELDAPLQSTEERLSAARQSLLGMTAGRSDPQYAAALRAVEEASESLTGEEAATGEQASSSYGGLGGGVERAEGKFDLGLYLANKVGRNARQGHKGSKKLARLSARLDRGLGKLATASKKISDGIAELSRGGETLSPGLQRLSQGADQLVSGLGAMQSGTGELGSGLGSGAQRSKLLTGALRRIHSGVERQRGTGAGGSGLQQLRRQSPGLFHSGYFLMAALDGSPAQRREQAGFLVNLDRGGHDARMLVVPSDEPGSAEGRSTTDRLQGAADELARETGSRVLVGGFGPSESDVNTAIRDQAPLTRLALALVTFLILIPVVRSLVLPLLAALINVLTVAATFGLLSLLFDGSLLGGPGYVDVTVLPATMIVIFGLAIDYEVFIFARIREEYVRTGSPSAAITNGLQRTGPVVSGAALIMIAVFLAFAVSSFVTLRDFGVAQAIAVFVDAFIVRLVVVPSLMRMLGHRSWWIPRWLDRLLPGGKPIPVEAAAARAEA
jgi:RND superfamily putative drug exporter